jgi:phosphoenolpyruvate carboxykinase (GTP)
MMTLEENKNALPQNTFVIRWVEAMAQLCKPDRLYWCDGSNEEKRRLIQTASALGELEVLNQEKLPGCYLHRSDKNDVARTEELTFICTPNK